MFASLPVYAEGVLVILSKDSQPYQLFYKHLIQALDEEASDPVDIKMVKLDDLNQSLLLGRNGKNFNLTITVGSKAAKAVSAIKTNSPVLCVMLPKRSFQSIMEGVDSQNQSRFSAMFLDQPLLRKFNLIRVALPEYKNVGVILGPATQAKHSEIKRIAAMGNIKLYSKNIQTSDALVNALNEVLDSNDILLTIADPVVVNRNTLHSLFMTSYMKRIPVVGYSRAYVQAGALLAVYSTPVQLGKQAGEILRQIVKSGKQLSSDVYYPKYFSVSVNKRVAKSLGILLKDEHEIQALMQSMEGGS